MKKGNLQLAIEKEALLGKSKVYIQRALRCKSQGDLDQYQLWASLSIELLGKSTLSSIHPSLIVDPTHYQSLFAASGINISTDIKTITAKTLFERLRRLSKKFDENVKKFCDAISHRRNAELHSGEVPFQNMKLEAWERHYWHAIQLILEISFSSLDEWLGADRAKAPKEIVKQAQEAIRDAVKTKIEYAANEFKKKNKRDREKALADAETKSVFQYRDFFTLISDADWELKCPACEGKAFMAGIQYGEEIVVDAISDVGEDWWGGLWEIVEKCFVAEEFYCAVCELHLVNQAEIEVAGLETEHFETEEREAEYEPDYGNE